MEKLIEVLNNGGMAVIPTDTIYGISARALDQKAVARVYEIKDSGKQKPFIILISSIEDLKIFGVELDDFAEEILKNYWPGKVTAVLDCKDEKFEYLHLGTKTLAFRVPDRDNLRELIKKTGPLISTSVNVEGREPASNIEKAKEYFGEKVDFYLDEGELESLPSTIIKIENRKVVVLREGAVYPIE